MTNYRFLLPILCLAVSTGGVLLAVEPPAAMHVDGVPEISEELDNRVQQFQNSRAASFISWHPTKREMLISTRFGDTDLYVASPLDSSREDLVVRADGTFTARAWSRDDAKALIVRYTSANETGAFVLDVGTQRLEPISVGVNKAYLWPTGFRSDGQAVYLISDHAGEFRQLYEYDLATGNLRSLAASIPWNVSGVALSPNGKTLAFVVNADGFSEVHLLDTESRRLLESPNLPRGVASWIEFHPTKNEFAVTITSSQSPGDIYSYDLDDKTTTRWTYSETGGGDLSALPEVELVHYPTFDQVEGDPRMIPAFVLKPAARFSGPRPVLISIHGGPESQVCPTFQRASFRYLLNELGVAVIQPNVRGSNGYGKSYLLLDNGAKREDSVKDIGALLDWIGTREDLDASRVAVIGGSYGGYMSLATMTHYSNKLKCGVELFGISHFGTFLRNTQDYRRHLRRAEYGDETGSTMWDLFETISPLNNAEKIKIPMLVFQGKNDPRVPYTESEQIVAKVRSNGGEVWYLLADNEGHGLAKKPNRDYFGYASLTFLNRCLLE